MDASVALDNSDDLTCNEAAETSDAETIETPADEMSEEDSLKIELDALERGDSQLMEEDGLGFKCSECGVTTCPMWRRLRNDKLVCNICHLKIVKNSMHISSKSINKVKDMQVVRISSRKNKSKKKFSNNFYGEKVFKNGGNKSRRSVYKKRPSKAVIGNATVVTTKSIFHNGVLLQVGDIVCTNDVDGGIYYAQLRGFLQDEYCEKSTVVTWLIPTKRGLKHFEPEHFVPGPDEETPRPLECFDFVCRASNDFFKARTTHTPFLRSQADLNSLIYIAQTVLQSQEENKDSALNGEAGVEESATDEKVVADEGVPNEEAPVAPTQSAIASDSINTSKQPIPTDEKMETQ